MHSNVMLHFMVQALQDPQLCSSTIMWYTERAGGGPEAYLNLATLALYKTIWSLHRNVFCLHRKTNSFSTLLLILSFPSEINAVIYPQRVSALEKTPVIYPDSWQGYAAILSGTAARCRIKWPFSRSFFKLNLPGIVQQPAADYIGRLAL